MNEESQSRPFSTLPQVEAAWNFPLFDAIMGRRSRRFGMGLELKAVRLQVGQGAVPT